MSLFFGIVKYILGHELFRSKTKNDAVAFDQIHRG